MAEEWNSFLGQLRMLDQSRQGEATLRGTTENDLVFRVHSSDKAGHMALEGHVGGTRYVGNQPSRIGLQFAFEFDAGTLADIVGAFGQLPHEG